jgi:hypothetical protein
LHGCSGRLVSVSIAKKRSNDLPLVGCSGLLIYPVTAPGVTIARTQLSRLLGGPNVAEPESDHGLQRTCVPAQAERAADSEGSDEGQTATRQLLVSDLNSGSVEPPPTRVYIAWFLNPDADVVVEALEQNFGVMPILRKTVAEFCAQL